MGNCASDLTCVTPDGPVQSDPDVAGLGVLVSFIATATITFFAIVVGYLSDSLPDENLTQLDRALLSEISNIKWRPWSRDGPMSALLRHSTATFSAVAGLKALIEHDKTLSQDEQSRRTRQRRSKGLERFILALSDQQLVTGVAILIAGFIHPCSMSMYHFNIVAALAWFSSTTHLSTLAVLRVYLIDHPRIRDWRVAAMLVVFILLALAQVVSYSTQDSSVPLRCTFSNYVQESRDDIFSILSLVVILVFLAVSYCNRIIRLYSFDPDWSVEDWFADILRALFGKHGGTDNLIRITIANSGKSKAEEGAMYRRLRERRRYVEHRGRWEKRHIGTRLHLSMIKLFFMTHEVQNSFLGDLLSLIFGFTFGVTSVTVSRVNKPSVGLSGDENIMSFGQLVPLLLIALPILAAGEVYFEQRESIGFVPSLKKRDTTKLLDYTGLINQQVDLLATIDMLESRHVPTLGGAMNERKMRTVVTSSTHLPAAGIDNPMANLDSPGGERPITSNGSDEASLTQEGPDAINHRRDSPLGHPAPACDAAEGQTNYVEGNETNQAISRQNQSKSQNIWRRFLLLFVVLATAQIYLAIFLGGVGGAIGQILSSAIVALYIYGSIGRIIANYTWSQAQRRRERNRTISESTA